MLNETWKLEHVSTDGESLVYKLRHAETAELIATIHFEADGRNMAKLKERVAAIAAAPASYAAMVRERDALAPSHQNDDCPRCNAPTDDAGYCDECGNTSARCRECGKAKFVDEITTSGRCVACAARGR